jgi:prefoldin subunit 5
VSLQLGGDAASCSQVGGSLRRIAGGLRMDAEQVSATFGDLHGHWSGGASVRARQRADTLCRVVRAAADDLDHAGSALQAHAADVAESAQALRQIAERAMSAGLQVVEGEVVPAWGVTGLADPSRDAHRDETRISLQRDLDHLMAQLSRRQSRLARAAETARQALASHAQRLRVGR